MSTTADHGGGVHTVVTLIQGRGRSIVATKPLKAGEIVLRDSPILLYSALPLNPQCNHNVYCSHCFKTLPQNPSPIPCPLCSSNALFCSPSCLYTALKSSHSPFACQTLARLRNHPSMRSDEVQAQARFLVAAYNLSRVSPSDFETLLSLNGGGCQPDYASTDAVFLHSLIISLCDSPSLREVMGFSTVEVTAALLARDRANAFGLMEPFGEGGKRSVRAYGIYPNASFFNHDCLPNACRFDYVGSDGPGNTDVVVRVIHDVPQGTEICLSYFPVNLKYAERQQRLKEDYDFTCTCDRCNVEVNWSDNEEGEEEEEVMEEDNDELMVDEDDGVQGEGGGEESDFPHAYFFLRYMCSRENCWGTLAPLPPSNGSPSSVMECNVCGNLKKDDYEGGMDGD